MSTTPAGEGVVKSSHDRQRGHHVVEDARHAWPGHGDRVPAGESPVQATSVRTTTSSFRRMPERPVTCAMRPRHRPDQRRGSSRFDAAGDGGRGDAQVHAPRVSGIWLFPSGALRTASTWWSWSPASSKPLIEPDM